VLDVEPDPVDRYGFTLIAPGFGLLRDKFTEPFVAHWDLVGREYAVSAQIPGVRVPYAPFCGIMGTAPDTAFRVEAARREAELADSGGAVMQPSPIEAIPADPSIAREGLRTIPPRENGGNLDVKQLTPGSTVLLPVYVPGALFSVGDVHFAQGDGESCGAAIEMRARVRLRFRVLRGGAAPGKNFAPVFTSPPPASARSRRLGTVGLCVEAGRNHAEDLTVAARRAVESMIQCLGLAGYSAEQAYVITSVAVDLSVSQVVDVPNVGVSALLDMGIFDDGGQRVLAAIGAE
jgi:formamidase